MSYKLKEILEYLDESESPDELEIQYRTRVETEDEVQDIFAGTCRYDFETGQLISEDGDNYSLNDRIVDYVYEYYDPEDEDAGVYLIVWYESGDVNV